MPRRVRLLLTISDLIGRGAEREFATLAARLDRSRFETELCFWRERMDYPCPEDLPRHVLDKTKPWHVGRTIGRLRSLVERFQPDVVFSQLHYVSMVTGSALAGARHRPAWVCRLVNDPRRDMPFPFSLWARRSLGRADRVAGCSRGVTQAAAEYLRLRPEQCLTLPNVVDVEQLQAQCGQSPAAGVSRPPGAFVVLFLGTLNRQKRADLLIEAFARFSAGRPKAAELWLVGDGPLGGSLRQMSGELGLGERVRFFGFQPNPQAWFQLADCLALPSDSEGLPNAIIEAQLGRLPVVATRCRFGPDELIQSGQTGLLVPTGDAEALAQALGQLADDPASRQRMALAAQAQAQRQFDTEAVVAQYEGLFLELAGRRVPGTRAGQAGE